MPDRISVHLDELRSAANRFAGQAEALSGAVARLGMEWSAGDEMYGRDRQGEACKAAYEPQAERLAQAIGEMARGLEGIADGLQAMAANHHAAETGSAVLGPV
jgi:uncharacterized protein YukE